MARKALTAAALLAALGMGAGIPDAMRIVDEYEWTGKETSTYRDVVGIPTICRGHTGNLTKLNRPATAAECDSATLHDLSIARRTVYSCVNRKLTPGEEAAWVSFAFNVGPGGKGVKDGMCTLKSGRTPSHVRYLNSDQPKAACAMLMQWTRAGGVVYRGLERRRATEMAYCLRDLT